MEANLPQLHTLTTVCERTQLSKSTVNREIKAGRLKAVYVGRAVRITEADLCRFIELLGA